MRSGAEGKSLPRPSANKIQNASTPASFKHPSPSSSFSWSNRNMRSESMVKMRFKSREREKIVKRNGEK